MINFIKAHKLKLLVFVIVALISIIFFMKTGIDQMKEKDSIKNGNLIYSLAQFNDLLDNYMVGDDFDEYELYKLSGRSTSASIESYNVGLFVLSINYSDIGDKLEKLANTWENDVHEYYKIKSEIRGLIEINEGIYKIIEENSDKIYLIDTEKLTSTMIRSQISTYDSENKKRLYNKLNEE